MNKLFEVYNYYGEDNREVLSNAYIAKDTYEERQRVIDEWVGPEDEVGYSDEELEAFLNGEKSCIETDLYPTFDDHSNFLFITIKTKKEKKEELKNDYQIALGDVDYMFGDD